MFLVGLFHQRRDYSSWGPLTICKNVDSWQLVHFQSGDCYTWGTSQILSTSHNYVSDQYLFFFQIPIFQHILRNERIPLLISNLSYYIYPPPRPHPPASAKLLKGLYRANLTCSVHTRLLVLDLDPTGKSPAGFQYLNKGRRNNSRSLCCKNIRRVTRDGSHPPLEGGLSSNKGKGALAEQLSKVTMHCKNTSK